MVTIVPEGPRLLITQCVTKQGTLRDRSGMSVSITHVFLGTKAMFQNDTSNVYILRHMLWLWTSMDAGKTRAGNYATDYSVHRDVGQHLHPHQKRVSRGSRWPLLGTRLAEIHSELQPCHEHSVEVSNGPRKRAQPPYSCTHSDFNHVKSWKIPDGKSIMLLSFRSLSWNSRGRG